MHFYRKMNVYSLYFFLPVVFILPTKFGLLTFFLLFVAILISGSNSCVNKRYLLYAVVFVILSISAFFPGVLLGSEEASEEAVKFVKRSISAAFIFVAANILFYKSNEESFVRFFYGTLLFIVLNSFIVVVTALKPELYGILKIDLFSGSLTPARYLRSPGLLQGYDVAGFTAVIGLIVLYFLLSGKRVSTITALISYVILIFSAALASRSSFMLFSLFSIIISFSSSKYGEYQLNKFIKAITFVMAVMSIYVIIVLVSAFWDNDLPDRLSFGLISLDDIVLYYNVGVDDYLSHYPFGVISFFPNGKEGFLPDNSYMRIAVVGGWWALIFVLISFFVIIFPLFKAFKAREGCGHNVLIFILATICISSLKTNYLYYVPFFLVFSVVWVWVASRITTVHLFDRGMRDRRYPWAGNP